MIGTSDQSCWLAEAFKIVLLFQELVNMFKRTCCRMQKAWETSLWAGH